MIDDKTLKDLVRALVTQETEAADAPATPRPRSTAEGQGNSGKPDASWKKSEPATDTALAAKAAAWLGGVVATPPALKNWRPKGDRSFYLGKSPARLGVGRSGTRCRTETLLHFLSDHAVARDAVVSPVNPDVLKDLGLVELTSAAADKREFLLRPDLGRRLSEGAKTLVNQQGTKGVQVQLVVMDGLSATAISVNAPKVIPALTQELTRMGVRVGTPFFIRNGRVACGDEVARLLKAQLLVTICGERPGLKSAESMGCYVTWMDVKDFNESKRSMISNIHSGGLKPEDAVRHIAALCKKALEQRKTGVELVP